MVDTRYLQCPFCGRLFQAWHQVGAKNVMCPCCTAEVALDGSAMQPPRRPSLRRWLAGMLDAALAPGLQAPP